MKKLTTEFREQEWTTRLLTQAFVWSGRVGPLCRDPQWFSGSARYGFILHEMAGLRVERLCGRDMDTISSRLTGVPDDLNLDSWYSRSYRRAHAQGLQAGSTYYFEISGENFIAATTVAEIMTSERHDPSDLTGIRFPTEFHHLENMWFEFAGDARAYRNAINMALFQLA